MTTIRINKSGTVCRYVCAVALLIGTSAAFAAAPEVSFVEMSQSASRQVMVKYRLSAPAVVTLDIQTNFVANGETRWASIGGENLGHVVGDVNRLVTESGVHTNYWFPDKAWPNHRIPNDGARAVVTAWAPDAPPDWMLVDLATKSNVTYYASVEALPYGHPTNAAYKTQAILFRKIPAAGRSFRMGITRGEATQDFTAGGQFSGTSEFASLDSRAPSHLVSFTNDFYMSVFQFTDGHYFTMNGSWASGHAASYKAAPHDMCPRTEISFNGLRGTPTADHYDWPKHAHEVSPTSELGKLRAYTGVEVDLPTEAQWEFACRAGEGRWRYDGASTCAADGADKICWYSCTGTIYENPVGMKEPNAWQLYDMYGNGHQLCLDWFAMGYADCGAIEPTGPVVSPQSKRVVRGHPSHYDIRYMASMLRPIWDPSSSHKWLTYRLAAPAVAK